MTAALTANQASLSASTAMHALGRIGSAMEIAEGIEYLVRAEWVTGVALESQPVDGLRVLLELVVVLEPGRHQQRQRHPAGVELPTELVDIAQRAVVDSGD